MWPHLLDTLPLVVASQPSKAHAALPNDRSPDARRKPSSAPSETQRHDVWERGRRGGRGVKELLLPAFTW